MKRWMLVLGSIAAFMATWAYLVMQVDLDTIQPGLNSVVFDVSIVTPLVVVCMIEVCIGSTNEM